MFEMFCYVCVEEAVLLAWPLFSSGIKLISICYLVSREVLA